MTNAERLLIQESQEYVRINYRSQNTHGHMICKYSLLELKLKKFNKAFKNCECHVERRYSITMKDIMESALRYYSSAYLHWLNCLERARTRTYQSEWEIKQFNEKIDKCKNRIERLERKLKDGK